MNLKEIKLNALKKRISERLNIVKIVQGSVSYSVIDNGRGGAGSFLVKGIYDFNLFDSKYGRTMPFRTIGQDRGYDNETEAKSAAIGAYISDLHQGQTYVIESGDMNLSGTSQKVTIKRPVQVQGYLENQLANTQTKA